MSFAPEKCFRRQEYWKSLSSSPREMSRVTVAHEQILVFEQVETMIYVLYLVAQSCPTLWYPMDCTPPGYSVNGDSPGKNTRMVCHVLLQRLSVQFSSVAQSCPTLRPHESQHARLPCPSPTPRVHSDSRPSSQWCHPAISSSVVPFSSCPQSLSASESFPRSQLFTWGGQSTGASASSWWKQHQSFQRILRIDFL